MLEVAASFLENRDFNTAREIQIILLQAYEQDFSKHAPDNIVPRIRMLWNSIPSQLARENRKFVSGLKNHSPGTPQVISSYQITTLSSAHIPQEAESSGLSRIFQHAFRYRQSADQWW